MKNAFVATIFLTLAVALLYGQSLPAKGEISGIVRDAKSGAPIGGARVTLDSSSGSTQSSGILKPVTTTLNGIFLR